MSFVKREKDNIEGVEMWLRRRMDRIKSVNGLGNVEILNRIKEGRTLSETLK